MKRRGRSRVGDPLLLEDGPMCAGLDRVARTSHIRGQPKHNAIRQQKPRRGASVILSGLAFPQSCPALAHFAAEKGCYWRVIGCCRIVLDKEMVAREAIVKPG